ncbi:DNA internalization-related competence protein ComEC/Rec2 [Shewanella sp. AS1]|uniref:DNA internalization-related competence protein ComEC/Rec2 n=1 Tax=Shewanella sp. AS1 TaxID=2907626 RepID=UPI001F2839D8|nr:DNA internalization-related competence protein ComEC/Rec2 [Shewanella sp. AS1]MCE9678395.1 DNA internalization-related competence protein ComEC/Rec2 [Shewanella sp. AS1]
MNRFMFGYCATLISALCWPGLLSPGLALCAIVAALLLFHRSQLLAGGVFAAAWLSLFCYQLLTFSVAEEKTNIAIRAEIISLVSRNGDWINADIRILDQNLPLGVPQYMRVDWPLQTQASPGEVWQLSIKPKPIASVLNQGGFNRQKYYLARHIMGKGKVVEAKRISEAAGLRSTLLNDFIQSIASFRHSGLMLALTLGDKSLVTNQDWQGLRQSGTGHLIAISGLHLSVLALWIVFASRALLYRITPSQSMANHHLSALLALVICCFYAYLSGFALPTQRALIMLTMVILLVWLRRHSSPFERLLWAMFVVLLIDPVSILSAGFWLSFSALAIILSASSLNKKEEAPSQAKGLRFRLGQLWAIQWRLSLCLGVLQTLLFGGIAPYSLLFNLIFVPWFSLVVIPLGFITMLLYLLSVSTGLLAELVQSLLILFDYAISPLTWSFTLLEHLPEAWMSVSASFSAAVIFLLLGLGLLRVITVARWRYLSLVLLLPSAILVANPWLNRLDNRWTLHLLDVGQGLSMVVEKQGRALMYDTGAAFGEGFSYAKSVTIPFLQYKGIDKLDHLIVSHGDNDHAGGVKVLIEHFGDVNIISDLPLAGARECRPAEFIWQGLTVQILGPEGKTAGNNGSCVVQIRDDWHRVLLPGDIEEGGERALLSSYAALDETGDLDGAGDLDETGALGSLAVGATRSALNSQVLIAPHHGSNTSSTRHFIQAVSPQYVLYGAGLNNHYGFPKAQVVSRYQAANARQYVVGENGQISLVFKQEKLDIIGFRYDMAPFWYNRRFEFGVFANPE